MTHRVTLHTLLCVLLFVGFPIPLHAQGPKEPIRGSDNQRYLVHADGKPFFYLGDTAWELFHRLSREEADQYLEDRAAKGFTVIQAVALAEEDGLNTPNPYGHRPLIDNDPATPAVVQGGNNDYWDHVDYIVNKANRLGMHIGFLPTWGDKWNKKWGVGPVVFNPENAKSYGRFLGERYGQKSVIWILGGDRPVETEEHRAIIEAMAMGIEDGDGGRNLMTFHPQGRQNSADIFHEAKWLDFNMIQSGHSRPAPPNYEYMLNNLAKKPAKPTLDGEPCYEDHPIKGKTWGQRNKPGVLLKWYDEWDVRVAAYQSMLAGACGHTYGDHNIWQMWQPGRPPKSVARTRWTDALSHPGSRQMKYFRLLFETRPFWKTKSDQAILLGDNPAGEDHVRAATSTDGSFAIIYIPTGKSISVDTEQLRGEKVRAWWFNPRQNSSQLIGTFAAKKRHPFVPPTSGRNNDWVLLIDDAVAELPEVGYSTQNLIPQTEE